ncbi:serine carboxypeptidase [Cooperia oncophora]
MNVLVLCLLISLTSAAPEWEQIKSLPNLVEPLRSKHYAGYVQVSQTKQLFYWVNNYGETVTRNPWTWNRYANIIYLDAPAGVGFSIRLDGLWDYTDTEVALDNYAAMKEWFKKFPERMTNDFYAAGESYAGTYIPMLSAILVDDKSINFKRSTNCSVEAFGNIEY